MIRTLGIAIVDFFQNLKIWKVPIQVNGFILQGAIFDRWLYLMLYKFRLIGNSDWNFLARHIEEGAKVLDIGANVGVITSGISRLVGSQGYVTAFEPDLRLFSCLKKTYSAMGCRMSGCLIWPLERASKACDSKDHVYNSGDNHVISKEGAIESDEVEMEVDRLDSVVNGHVDFIKIDVQGYELFVFEGMTNLLEANPQVKIFFEFWPKGFLNAQVAPLDVLTFLTSRGFLLVKVDDGKELKSVDEFCRSFPPKSYCNLLALKG